MKRTSFSMVAIPALCILSACAGTHATQSADHSAQAASHASAATALSASTVVAVPLVVTGSALVVSGAAIQSGADTIATDVTADAPPRLHDEG